MAATPSDADRPRRPRKPAAKAPVKPPAKAPTQPIEPMEAGGRWVQPPPRTVAGTAPSPGATPPPAPPRPVPAAPPPPTVTHGAPAAPAAPFAWVQVAQPPATIAAPVPATIDPAAGEQRRLDALTADMGAAAALALTLGLVALMLGSFLTGISSQTFLGSSLVSEFGRGFRFRLLAVFAEASFEPAVALVLAVLLSASAPAGRRSAVRRPALYLASGLGVYIACAATLRAVALMTFLGTAAALAVGSTVSALAAIPVAAAATAWAVVLLTRTPDPSNSLQ